MHWIFRTGVAVVLAGSLASGEALAQAADAQAPSQAAQDEAGAHFRRGLELFKEADFRGALIELRRAHQIAPNFRVLYNIGQCSLELQDYAGALRSLQAYLSEGGARIPRDRRAAVEADIQKLRGRVANVEITSNVTGAEVRVDDDVVGTTPLAQPVLVGSGRRKITVEKAGLPPSVKVIDVAGGDKLSVALPVNQPTPGALAAAPAPAPAPAPSPPPPAEPAPAKAAAAPPPHETPAPADASSSSSYLWVGWTLTGAFAAGAAVTGVLALGAKSDSDKDLGTVPGNATAISDAHKKTQTLALVTDGLGAAAIIAGGLSLYFTLRSGSSGSSKTGAAGAPAPAPEGPTLRVGLGPQSVLLRGEF